MNDSTANASVQWTQEASNKIDTEAMTVAHNAHTLDLFSEQSLTALIDKYPKDKLQVFTMGDDPENRSDWEPVDTTDASGADIMHAIRVGRVWVKLMRIDLNDPRCKSLIDSLYQQIEQSCPNLNLAWVRPMILISSPKALVYYHADPQPTMLWQVSGVKRVWIYPAMSEDFIDQTLMEEIFSGVVDEEAPYDPEFDKSAKVFDLEPGQLLLWPPNAPHRVTNHDNVNVSLSVAFGTESSEQRALTYKSNFFLRKKLGLKNLSTSEQGLSNFLKVNAFRVANRLGKSKVAERQPYLAHYRIDRTSPTGVSRIESGAVKVPF